MRIVVVSTLIFLLLYLKIRRNAFFLSLSLSLPQHDHGLIDVSKFVNMMNSSYLVMFIACNVIFMAIFFGSFKPSCGDFTSCIDLPPLVYDVENAREKAKDEDCDDSDEDFVPRLVHVEYKNKDFASSASFPPLIEYREIGKEDNSDYSNTNDVLPLSSSVFPLVCEVGYEREKAKGEDYDDTNDDFVPRLVCIEYKGEKTKDEYWLANIDYGSGYDGYGNEDDGSDNNATSGVEENDDLEGKFDGFIAKMYKNWREELLKDKMLCLPAA